MAEEPERRSILIPLLLLYLTWYMGVPIWLVVLIGIWYSALVYAESAGILDRFDATRALGVILMVRTRRGMRVLEAISKHKRFWRAFGEGSIWLCFLVMFGVVMLLMLSAISAAISPPDDYLPASDLLLIPGVTSFVPFWWPALALIIAIIIHEYSHGIQARAHGMRLRSFGLLQLGPLPIGAFAEPEQTEMERAPRRERLRLFAAGPSINIFATYIVLIMLSSVASGMVAEQDGVHARDIVLGQAAEEGGILPFETITHIGGNEIADYNSFEDEMDKLSSGDVVSLTVLSRPLEEGPRESRLVTVTLGDRYQYYLDECDEDQSCIDDRIELLDLLEIEQGDAFLGVSGLVSSTGGVDGYASIVDGGYSSSWTVVVTLIRPLLMLNVPISNDGQTMILEERAMLVAGDGAIASAIGTEGMLMLFDFLFWLVWINFLLGFANLIPMIPFDGGHLVRDGAHSVLSRIRSKVHPMRIERLSNRISSLSSIFILLMLLIPVIIPRLI
tara:strand:- start:78 stop:1586 length:1509 start_codon:yes stop_codon:yes gene_type:complete